ncbi:extracellular calcium-sensing receptor-like [Montipora foliosa]|uniref:extracellular calcium-sensing receptor-like n=1 Tax=Montipora foliosa TaxID=591990 RepID=UPI0035F11451
MLPVFVIFTVTCCLASAPADTRKSRSYQSGDIILGGLFLLHYSRDDGHCGDFFPIGLGHVEAMIFAIEKINDDPKLLPNVTLGYDIRDYCEITAKAMKYTYDFARRNDIAFSANIESAVCDNGWNGTSNKDQPIAAVVGPIDSGSAIVVGSLLQVAGIPVVSPSATSNELSSAQYRHFFRTAPPDDQQARAMADIIERFNWTYVAVVAMDDSYGRNGARNVEIEAERRETFCVAFSEFITRRDYDAKLVRAVTKIKRYPNVRVVLLWLFGSYGRRFLKEAVRQKLSDRTWILSDALATERDVFVGLENKEQNIVHGSLGVQPRYFEEQNFESFLLQGLQSKRHRVHWWEELLNGTNQEICSLNARQNSSNDCQEMLLRSTHDTFIPYVIDAVYSIAHAIHQYLLENCASFKEKTSSPGKRCPDTIPFVDPQEVERHLGEVDFQGLTGNISFDSFGDPVSSSYDIVHFQAGNARSGQRHTVKLFIGSWEKGRQTPLRLNNTFIRWNTVESQSSMIIPKSICHEDCPPGTFQSKTTPCCFECIKCPAGTFSTVANSWNCTECPRGQRPDESRSECLDLPEIHLSWSSATSVVIILFGSAGISLVAICAVIFYRHRDTPLIKAANRELSLILLIAIFLSFSVSILSLAKPTNIMCGLRICWRSTLLATFISILILKTMRILGAFRINIVAERIKKWILTAKSQSLLVLALISLHLVLLLFWIALDPPHQKRNVQPVEGTILLSCTLYHSSIGQTFQIATTVYTSFLAIVCTIYAFKARTLPENFNEARYVAFSMYILLLSALAYYPVDLGMTGFYATNITAAGTLLSSYGLLACMFAPKMYVIFCRPEQNTQEAASSQVSEFSFSSNQKNKVSIAPNISNARINLECPRQENDIVLVTTCSH